MYRAYGLLEELDITLGELERSTSWSRTTWSRFLRNLLDPEPDGIRREFQEFLHARGISIPRDLWTRPEGAADPAEQRGEIQMRGQALLDDARAAFRLFRNPFDPDAIVDTDGSDRLHDLFLPAPHRFAEARLVQAFTSAGFVAIYGEPGTGKSTLLQRARRAAAARKPLIVVSPANIERRKMTAMHIAAEIIRQLSEESVPRTANVRDHKASEVLQQRYEAGQRVALVIDEAHELPDTTLKDLKRYHELGDSYIRLLAIILVGQSELAERFELDRNRKLREAIIRCQLVHLPPMKSPGDVRGYMETRFRWVGADLDAVWDPGAVEELERRLAEHDQQIPVLIGNVATAAMNVAWSHGSTRVSEDEVIEVTTASPAELRAKGLA